MTEDSCWALSKRHFSKTLLRCCVSRFNLKSLRFSNLGFLFGAIGKFVEAHERLDRAQALFTRLNDSVHLAQVEEAGADAFLRKPEGIGSVVGTITRLLGEQDEG